jgi:hypothetical protein
VPQERDRDQRQQRTDQHEARDHRLARPRAGARDVVVVEADQRAAGRARRQRVVAERAHLARDRAARSATVAVRVGDQAEAALDVAAAAVQVLPEIGDRRGRQRAGERHALGVARLVDGEQHEVVVLVVLELLDADLGGGGRRLAAHVRGVEILQRLRQERQVDGRHRVRLDAGVACEGRRGAVDRDRRDLHLLAAAEVGGRFPQLVVLRRRERGVAVRLRAQELPLVDVALAVGRVLPAHLDRVLATGRTRERAGHRRHLGVDGDVVREHVVERTDRIDIGDRPDLLGERIEAAAAALVGRRDGVVDAERDADHRADVVGVVERRLDVAAGGDAVGLIGGAAVGADPDLDARVGGTGRRRLVAEADLVAGVGVVDSVELTAHAAREVEAVLHLAVVLVGQDAVERGGVDAVGDIGLELDRAAGEDRIGVGNRRGGDDQREGCKGQTHRGDLGLQTRCPGTAKLLATMARITGSTNASQRANLAFGPRARCHRDTRISVASALARGSRSAAPPHCAA